MRHLLFNTEPQSCFPNVHYEEFPDVTSSLVNGLHSLWLPSALDPRISMNALHLNGKRETTVGEYTAAYYKRRAQSGGAPAGLVVPAGAGGNITTPFGRAYAYSNEQLGLAVGALGYAPVWSGDGANKTLSFCTWFRINRVNGTGFPTLIGNNFSNTFWLGLRTSTGKYKAIFRNSSSPYGPFEWGAYGADLRKVACVAFVLPMDANKTASVYHNGVLAVQATLANASSVSGNLDVWALSSATPGMFAEIFGFASWTRALYAEEIRELALGPWTLLNKRASFWYAPLMAYRSAQIAGESSFGAVGFRAAARSAEIAGTSSLMAYLRPPAAPERTWLLQHERRSVSTAAESRTLAVRRENRGIDA